MADIEWISDDAMIGNAYRVLTMNFDISDDVEGENEYALNYNLQRIEIAERQIEKITDPAMRVVYDALLKRFRKKTERALGSNN